LKILASVMTVSVLTLGAMVPEPRSARADSGVTIGGDEQARAGVRFTSHDSLEQLSPQTKNAWWAVVVDNATSKSSVVRTVDSGAHWQNVTPPVSQLRVGSISGDFLNAEIGWVLAVPLSQPSSPTPAEAVFRTLDGGRSWEPLGTVPDGCQLDFVDRDNGWCTVLGAAAGSEGVSTFRTSDGGVAWDLVTQTAEPPATSTPGALSFGCDKDVTFTSLTVGWASTDCAAGVPYLYTSDDAGARWQRLPQIPVPAGVSISYGWEMSPPVVAGNDLAVAVAFDGTPGESAVATSSNRGGTWRTQVVPGLGKPTIVALIDPTHWIGTNGTVLVASDDGGTHWQKWKPAVAMRDSLGTPLRLDFLSPMLGWAVSRDAGGPLWWTTDGGRTWVPIAVTTSS
jgi:photosystem II stability/assembly factor-like uncharacterized protein